MPPPNRNNYYVDDRDSGVDPNFIAYNQPTTRVDEDGTYYELPDLVVEEKRFDGYDIDIPIGTVDWIMSSGETRTQQAYYMQYMADRLGWVDGWDVYEIDKTNAMINIYESTWNKITGREDDFWNLPNPIEMVNDIFKKFVKDKNGDPARLPEEVLTAGGYRDDDLGKNFVQDIPVFLTTDELLESVSTGQPYIMPSDMAEVNKSNNAFIRWLDDNIIDPVEGFGVAIQKAVGGKAPEMILNSIGFANGMPFLGSAINAIADLLGPKKGSAWLDYLQNNGYIDANGNTLKDFDPTYWGQARDTLNDFFNNPPEDENGNRDYGMQLETEQMFAESIRNILVEEAGVDPELIKDMSVESLTELSGYISDILTEDQISAIPAGRQDISDYDNYYNDGTETGTDFSQELDQLEQWVQDQTVNPSEWFDRLGIKPEDATAFGNAAGDRIGGFLSNHFTDAYNGVGGWDDYNWFGHNGDQDWWDYHINQTNQYVNPVFDELAQNHIIANTGLFPNSNDNITGTTSLFAQYTDGTYGILGDMSGDWGTATDVFNNRDQWGYSGWHTSQFYEDNTGDGYADDTTDSGDFFNAKNTPSNSLNSSALMKSIGIVNVDDFGRSDESGRSLTFDKIQEDYRNGLSNLNEKYLNKEIGIEQLLQGQEDLGKMKDDALQKRREELEYQDEWTEEELEDLVEEFGLEAAEEISGIDIDDSGSIGETGLSQEDYGRQRTYDRDMESYGDNDGDNIPDYPKDEFGDTAVNPSTGETYGFKDGRSIYDADVDTGEALRPGSELKSDFEKEWLDVFGDPNATSWTETAPGVFEPNGYYNYQDTNTGYTYSYDPETGYTTIDYGPNTDYVGIDKDGDNYADGYDTDGDGIADTFLGTNVRKENDENPYGENVQGYLDEGRDVRIVNEDGTVTDARTGNVLDDPRTQKFDEDGYVVDKSTGKKYGRGSDGSLQEYSDGGLHPKEVEMIDNFGWHDNGDGTISKIRGSGAKVNFEDDTVGQGSIVGYHGDNNTMLGDDQGGGSQGSSGGLVNIGTDNQLTTNEQNAVNSGDYIDNGDGTISRIGTTDKINYNQETETYEKVGSLSEPASDPNANQGSDQGSDQSSNQGGSSGGLIGDDSSNSVGVGDNIDMKSYDWNGDGFLTGSELSNYDYNMENGQLPSDIGQHNQDMIHYPIESKINEARNLIEEGRTEEAASILNDLRLNPPEGKNRKQVDVQLRNVGLFEDSGENPVYYESGNIVVRQPVTSDQEGDTSGGDQSGDTSGGNQSGNQNNVDVGNQNNNQGNQNNNQEDQDGGGSSGSSGGSSGGVSAGGGMNTGGNLIGTTPGENDGSGASGGGETSGEEIVGNEGGDTNAGGGDAGGDTSGGDITVGEGTTVGNEEEIAGNTGQDLNTDVVTTTTNPGDLDEEIAGAINTTVGSGEGNTSMFTTDTSISGDLLTGGFLDSTETSVSTDIGGNTTDVDTTIDTTTDTTTDTTNTTTDTTTGEVPQIFTGTQPGLEGTIFDTSGTIGGNTEVADDNTGIGNAGESGGAEDFDLAYEYAVTIGAPNPESYRGKGLAGILGIAEEYETLSAEAALRTQSKIATQQQAVDNQLRKIQKGEDLDLIGQFGESYRDSLRALQPERSALTQELYTQAMKKYDDLDKPFTSRELADARRESYALASAQGRQFDPVLGLYTYNQMDGVRDKKEQAATTAALNAFNTAGSLDNNVLNALMMGSKFTPTTVTPSFSSGTAMNLGLGNFANQQAYQQNQEAQRIAQENYRAAVAAGEPSGIEKAYNDLQEVIMYGTAAKEGYEFFFGDGDGSGGFFGQAVDFGKDVIGGAAGVVGDILNFGTTEQITDAGASDGYDYSRNTPEYSNWEQSFNAKNDQYSDTVSDIIDSFTPGGSAMDAAKDSGKSWSEANKPFGGYSWCWVAREVYGANNPKWLMFREWLFTKAPVWFKNLYGKYGERFAKFISNKPRVKKLIRNWMDTKIK